MKNIVFKGESEGFIDLSGLIVVVIFFAIGFFSIPVAAGFMVLGFIFRKRFSEHKKQWNFMIFQSGLLFLVFLLPVILVWQQILWDTADGLYLTLGAFALLPLLYFGWVFNKWLHSNKKSLKVLLDKYGYRFTYITQLFMSYSAAFLLFFFFYMYLANPSRRSEFELMGDIFMAPVLFLGGFYLVVNYYCSRWLGYSRTRKVADFFVMLAIASNIFIIAFFYIAFGSNF